MKEDNNTDSKIKWPVLTTVSNDIEFEMITGVLEMADIPAIRKVYGVDGFAEVLFGLPISGIDVLVPEDRLQEAKELLNASTEEFEKEIEKEIQESIDKKSDE